MKLIKLIPALFFLAPFIVHAEAGVTNNKITIGQSAAFSGPAAGLGTNVRAGAMAYFDQINKAGGVHGRQIELISLDDGYESELAAENTKQLIGRHNVFALFGYVGTPTSLAAQPIFDAAGTLFFGPVTGAEKLRKPFNRNIFNVRASYFDETEEIVKFLGKERAATAAVVYQNDSYGQAGLAGVVRAMDMIGCTPACKPVGTATVERNSVDVSAAVAKMVELKPKIVIIITAYKSSAQISKMLDKALPGTQKMNVSFVGTTELIQELGKEGRGTVISQVVPFPYGNLEPLIKEYRKAIGDKISFTSLEGYINAAVFVEGLKRAGPDLTRAKFIKALESAGKIDLQGFLVAFSPENHNGSKFVETTMVRGNGTITR